MKDKTQQPPAPGTPTTKPLQTPLGAASGGGVGGFDTGVGGSVGGQYQTKPLQISMSPGDNSAPAANPSGSNPFLAGYQSTAAPGTSQVLDQRYQQYVNSGQAMPWVAGEPGSVQTPLPTIPAAGGGNPPPPPPTGGGMATSVDAIPGAKQTTFDPNQLAQATGAAGTSSPMGPGGDIAGAIKNAQDAAYKNATGYLDPQFANQQNTLTNQLVNQGVPQGSEAWNKAQDDFARQKQFAYSQAESGAQGQGLTAQNQIASQLLAALGINTQAGTQRFGIQTGANTAANQLAEQANTDTFNQSMGMRQQDINELLLQQQNPLTMYNSLTNGTNPQQPNFTNTPGTNVGGTDIASIIQQALGQQNNVYNTQVGAQNSQNSGMATILAALISDRRLKTHIRKIGMHVCGVPLYTYNYVWGEPGIGVMADELEKVRPDAVFDFHGIKAVNYGAIS